MKVGKILIVMILAALGFQVNAQRATFVHESYNSVRQYIHPLRLSQNQVADWSRLNRATDFAISDIEYSRGSARSKARRVEGVLERHDRRLGNILSRRQLAKYYNLRVNDRNSRYYNNRGNNYCPSGYSNQGRQRDDNRNDDRNDDRNDNRNDDRNNNRNDNRNNNQNDNRDARYNNSGSYYDGGSNYRS